MFLLYLISAHIPDLFGKTSYLVTTHTVFIWSSTVNSIQVSRIQNEINLKLSIVNLFNREKTPWLTISSLIIDSLWNVGEVQRIFKRKICNTASTEMLIEAASHTWMTACIPCTNTNCLVLQTCFSFTEKECNCA